MSESGGGDEGTSVKFVSGQEAGARVLSECRTGPTDCINLLSCCASASPQTPHSTSLQSCSLPALC